MDPRLTDCGDDALNCLQLGHSSRLLAGIHIISSNLPSVIEKLRLLLISDGNKNIFYEKKKI